MSEAVSGYDDFHNEFGYSYDYDEPEDECDHDEYEIDILTGRASCERCPHSWWATDAQIAAEARRQADYANWVAEQERPWNRFKEWLGQSWPVLQWRIFWRRRWLRDRYAALSTDDDIPF